MSLAFQQASRSAFFKNFSDFWFASDILMKTIRKFWSNEIRFFFQKLNLKTNIFFRKKNYEIFICSVLFTSWHCSNTRRVLWYEVNKFQQRHGVLWFMTVTKPRFSQIILIYVKLQFYSFVYVGTNVLWLALI